jgi:hypothetical protein
LPSSPTVAGFPNRGRLPEPSPASPAVAGFPSRRRLSKPLPVSPAVAGFSSCRRLPQPLPASPAVAGAPACCRLPQMSAVFPTVAGLPGHVQSIVVGFHFLARGCDKASPFSLSAVFAHTRETSATQTETAATPQPVATPSGGHVVSASVLPIPPSCRYHNNGQNHQISAMQRSSLHRYSVRSVRG